MKTLSVTGIAIVICGLLVAVVYVRRINTENHLFADLARGEDRSPEQEIRLVRELGSCSGEHSTEFLLNIALDRKVRASEAARAEAIQVLGSRGNSSTAITLSDLLQPHEEVGVRTAAATALERLPCIGECNRAVMHYLERLWWGELNQEERLSAPSALQAKHQLAIWRAEEEELRRILYSVLIRQKEETEHNLATIYGLGTPAPSGFAFVLASRLGLREACPLILESERAMHDDGPIVELAPREEISNAIKTLNCK